MNLADFNHKKVALLGAGVENLALLPHLLQSGAIVTVCDKGDKQFVEQRVDNSAVSLITGEYYLENLEGFDYLFRIAGLPVKQVQAAIEKLEKKPVITSPINLFIEVCPCQTIGITGTKGKGTTTTLIATILQETGRKVFVGGNINEPVFGFIDEISPDDIVVLELSSFQLEDVDFSPQIAVILPITEDHLQPLSAQNPNYHETIADYAAAKGNITAFQEPDNLLVYASNSSTTAEIASNSNAHKIAVSAKGSADLQILPSGKLMHNESLLLDLSQTGLRGEHVFLDAALAVAVGREFGLSSVQMIAALKKYVPLPHRMQKIAEIDGVTYVDDSYATAPDAAIAAIKAFSDKKIVWIGGGSRKGVDFTALAQEIVDSTVKQVVLVGQEASRITEALQRAGFKYQISSMNSFQGAVAQAKYLAKSGDVVLLSPACASLDMFKSAADRGEQFTNLVLDKSN